MKQLFNFLFSTKLTGLLFVIFAASMGIATFIENDYGTQTAKALIYNTWWFEMIMIIFTINFIGNIQKYKLYKKEKLATLVFHLAFALIILGAGITRYISFEGIMPIYEGETTDIMLSDRAYIKVHIDDGMDQKSPVFKDQLFANIPDEEKGFIAITSRFLNLIRGGNNFNISTDFKGEPIQIKYKNYIANAYESFVNVENGDTFLKIVESSGSGRHEHYIKSGEVVDLHNTLISFEYPTKGAINIFTENDGLKINAPFDGNFMMKVGLLKILHRFLI
jgi:hypothetical protein